MGMLRDNKNGGRFFIIAAIIIVLLLVISRYIKWPILVVAAVVIAALFVMKSRRFFIGKSHLSGNDKGETDYETQTIYEKRTNNDFVPERIDVKRSASSIERDITSANENSVPAEDPNTFMVGLKKQLGKNPIAFAVVASTIVILLIYGGSSFLKSETSDGLDEPKQGSMSSAEISNSASDKTEGQSSASAKSSVSNSKPSNTTESSKKDDTSEVKAILSRIRKTPVADLLPKLQALGYSPSFKHAITGEDFTNSVLNGVENPDSEDSIEWLATGYESLNTSNKTVVILIDNQENLDRVESQNNATKTLENKLDPSVAWGTASEYGKRVYPNGFKIHMITENYAETPEDGNTWLLKAGCDVTNAYGEKIHGTMEARVTGTDDNPEIVYFEVY